MFKLLASLFSRSKSPPTATPPAADLPVLHLPSREPTSRRAAGVPDPGCVFFVPFAVIRETALVMRRFGHERRECYVWWGGYHHADGSAQIVTAIYPDMATQYGHIQLDQPDISALQQKLRELDQVLLVELHTHPPMAGGQNEVDAAHPAAPYAGFMSIVVPSFGFMNLADLCDTHVYEYISANRWRILHKPEIARRFVVDPTLERVVRP